MITKKNTRCFHLYFLHLGFLIQKGGKFLLVLN